MNTLELNAHVANWRQKALAGTITQDEMREAIKMLRAGRVSASHASAKSRGTRAAKAPVDVDDLLKELDI